MIAHPLKAAVAMLFCGFVCLPSAHLSAQILPSKTEKATPVSASTSAPAVPAPVGVPLNLDADKVTDQVTRQVAKEMSKDAPATNVTPDVFKTMHDDFEKSLGNYEHRKKISGVVEAGVGTGSLSAPRGAKSETVTCEYAAAAVNDDISKNAQVSIYAQTSSCKTK
ncbi:hypothetical protein ACO0K7_05295 [Undibacterium sp. Ji67W]|uniref:hypothetical protein n=1 Tax=Undibacterium sp. Ji67W TaxID=3413042 RepID=UPI003BF3AD30